MIESTRGITFYGLSKKFNNLYCWGGLYFHPKKIKKLIPNISEKSLSLFKKVEGDPLILFSEQERTEAFSELYSLTVEKFPELFI